MPPTITAKPDGEKIRDLIDEWAKARRRAGSLTRRQGAVTPFARKIGRPRQSVQNIISYEPDTGRTFIRQIAAELGVKPSAISDMPPEDDDTESGAETKALAS